MSTFSKFSFAFQRHINQSTQLSSESFYSRFNPLEICMWEHDLVISKRGYELSHPFNFVLANLKTKNGCVLQTALLIKEKREQINANFLAFVA